MSGWLPTLEQDEALAYFGTGKSLAIEAGAGAGKTSTLVLLAGSTSRRGQYVAFNKAIVQESTEKMPGNVRCNTAHSLAFRAVGKRFAHRLNSPRMKSYEIGRRLRLDPMFVDYEGSRKVLQVGYLGSLVMRTVTAFCQSADRDPSVDHVPYIDGIDDMVDGRRGYSNNRLVQRHILPAVRAAWKDLCDVQGQLPYKHDHYLKLAQLEGIRIAADFIMFDEAQDANPVLVAIVAAQTHAQLVWVGDSQQAIYGFTGAVNALEQVGAEQRSFLTQSFRFGPAVAEVANGLLSRLDADLRIKGFDKVPSVVGPVAEPDVILTRTNAAAVIAVLGAVRDGRKPHLVGGGREILDFAEAAQRLMDGDPAGHPELSCFDTWDEVRRYVIEDQQGGELKLLVELIDEFGVETIQEALASMGQEKDADVVVSTAHKSKGREWNSVRLADDFPDDLAQAGAEELRLLYVAVTRAKRELDITNVPYLAGLPVHEPPRDVLTAPDATPPAPPAAPSSNNGDGGEELLAVSDDELRELRAVATRAGVLVKMLAAHPGNASDEVRVLALELNESLTLLKQVYMEAVEA